MSFQPSTQPPTWRIRPVPIWPKIQSSLRSSGLPQTSWSTKISTIHEESIILYCCTSTKGMRLDSGRKNIFNSLFGMGDRIRSNHVTYYTEPNPYISQVLEWAQLKLPITLSPIQEYHRHWNRLNPCALSIWAKFWHVTCKKAEIGSTCMTDYWARSIHITGWNMFNLHALSHSAIFTHFTKVWNGLTLHAPSLWAKSKHIIREEPQLVRGQYFIPELLTWHNCCLDAGLLGVAAT